MVHGCVSISVFQYFHMFVAHQVHSHNVPFECQLIHQSDKNFVQRHPNEEEKLAKFTFLLLIWIRFFFGSVEHFGHIGLINLNMTSVTG